ncbi:WEB family protein [Gossypium australe]|uniref:WEB family protein n=1 Tax=Gossypium australe TaxID=47621 RepID=A0A5B6UVK8_9ROSI|nr:WEB family protein [Gossypium australe]
MTDHLQALAIQADVLSVKYELESDRGRELTWLFKKVKALSIRARLDRIIVTLEHHYYARRKAKVMDQRFEKLEQMQKEVQDRLQAQMQEQLTKVQQDMKDQMLESQKSMMNQLTQLLLGGQKKKERALWSTPGMTVKTLSIHRVSPRQIPQRSPMHTHLGCPSISVPSIKLAFQR